MIFFIWLFTLHGIAVAAGSDKCVLRRYAHNTSYSHSIHAVTQFPAEPGGVRERNVRVIEALSGRVEAFSGWVEALSG